MAEEQERVPIACGLCGVRLASVKDWDQHARSAEHLANLAEPARVMAALERSQGEIWAALEASRN